MTEQIAIYDTTLYATEKWADLPLTAAEKMRVLDRLDQLGLAYIEIGPVAPSEKAFLNAVKDRPLKNARVVLFNPADPLQTGTLEHLEAMLETHIATCTVGGEASLSRSRPDSGRSGAQELKRIQESIGLLKGEGREVVFDAHHFFDGFKRDPEYALAAIAAAGESGADTITLCDTSGMSLPWEAGKIVHYVRPLLKGARLGIHMYNTRDCAVANSVAASAQGVDQVRGAINGYGARSGHANLCNIIPDLELKMGYVCLSAGSLPDLLDVSRYLAQMSGLSGPELMPYVGKSDFAPV